MWKFGGIGVHSFEDSFPHAGHSATEGHIFTDADDPSAHMDRTEDALHATFLILSRMAGNEREIDAKTLQEAREALSIKDPKEGMKAVMVLAGLPTDRENFSDDEGAQFAEMFKETRERGIYKFPDPDRQ